MEKQDQIDLLNGRLARLHRESSEAIERLRQNAAELSDRTIFTPNAVLGFAQAIMSDAESYAAVQQGISVARDDLRALEGR